MAHASLVPSLNEDVHFVLCDFGRAGLAYVETDPDEADATTVVQNLLHGQYERPKRVLALLADPRARRVARGAPSRGAITIYRLRDESHASILIACTKCDWKAAFDRDELIAAHGADYPLPNLPSLVAAPDCSRVGSQWDRCGRTTLSPIEGGVSPLDF